MIYFVDIDICDKRIETTRKKCQIHIYGDKMPSQRNAQKGFTSIYKLLILKIKG